MKERAEGGNDLAPSDSQVRVPFEHEAHGPRIQPLAALELPPQHPVHGLVGLRLAVRRRDEQSQQGDVAVVAVAHDVEMGAFDVEGMKEEQVGGVLEGHLGERVGDGDVDPDLAQGVLHLRFLHHDRRPLRPRNLPEQTPLPQKSPRVAPRQIRLGTILHEFHQLVPFEHRVRTRHPRIVPKRPLLDQFREFQDARSGHSDVERLVRLLAVHEQVETHGLVLRGEDLDAAEGQVLLGILIPRKFLDHLEEGSGLSAGPDEGQDLTAVGEVRLEVQVQVHVSIHHGGNRLDVIHAKALGHAAEVGRGHGAQEPGDDSFDGPSLLLSQLVDNGRLRHPLNVDVVRRLPTRTVGGRRRAAAQSVREGRSREVPRHASGTGHVRPPVAVAVEAPSAFAARRGRRRVVPPLRGRRRVPILSASASVGRLHSSCFFSRRVSLSGRDFVAGSGIAVVVVLFVVFGRRAQGPRRNGRARRREYLSKDRNRRRRRRQASEGRVGRGGGGGRRSETLRGGDGGGGG
mmetsp:Transcript_5040/g.8692  ORF Transcript_5040/g.8692 Transcript_5040/m.8692 type:complete len:516 (+) Transcript_5040:529-2076(+)